MPEPWNSAESENIIYHLDIRDRAGFAKSLEKCTHKFTYLIIQSRAIVFISSDNDDAAETFIFESGPTDYSPEIMHQLDDVDQSIGGRIIVLRLSSDEVRLIVEEINAAHSPIKLYIYSADGRHILHLRWGTLYDDLRHFNNFQLQSVIPPAQFNGSFFILRIKRMDKITNWFFMK